MILYNTLSHEREEFKPISSREIKVYSCGPTVYNYAHIGNLRTFTFEDIVVKSLRFLGYKVTYLMNITDVDDKTIKASKEANESLRDYTKRYSEYFLHDLERLNITLPDKIIPITSIISSMVRMINTMLRKGNAYLGDDGSIYFNIKTFSKYGEFAHLDMQNLKAGARVDNDEYDKENASDFVLWKAYKEEDGDNYWEEKFIIEGGKEIILKGRPGWHIECSACNMEFLGKQIDIHMGGVDLIFPHHQNEIAQSESCTGIPFAKYWLHSGHLMIEGKKMSKSLGNFYTLNDIISIASEGGQLKAIGTKKLMRSIRLSFINAKYSRELDFSFDKITDNVNAIIGIDETLKTLKRAIDKNTLLRLPSREFSQELQKQLRDYIDALEDDFNMPVAISVFHESLKYINSGIRENIFSHKELLSLMELLKTYNEVLAIIDFEVGDSADIPDLINEMLKRRNTARKDKNYEEADKLRDELLNIGYKIVDTNEESYLEKI